MVARQRMDARQLIEVALVLKPAFGGAVVEHDEDGIAHLIWLDGTAPTDLEWEAGIVAHLAGVRTRALAQVDGEAERQRLRFITPGAGQALTYQRKAEEARAALAAADPQPADYPMLAASLGVDGDTIAAVASVVQARDDAWGRIGAAIETRRLVLKRDVAGAPDAASLAAIDIAAGWPA